MEATMDPTSPGARLDADHPKNRGLIPCRFTPRLALAQYEAAMVPESRNDWQDAQDKKNAASLLAGGDTLWDYWTPKCQGDALVPGTDCSGRYFQGVDNYTKALRWGVGSQKTKDRIIYICTQFQKTHSPLANYSQCYSYRNAAVAAVSTPSQSKSPSTAATSAPADKYNALLDGLVAQDSETWAVNKYRRGSMTNASVISRSTNRSEIKVPG